jgi:hypothetical protein
MKFPRKTLNNGISYNESKINLNEEIFLKKKMQVTSFLYKSMYILIFYHE